MPFFLPGLPALAVSAIYCVWAAYQREQLRRQRQRCERVAYLLWCAALHDVDGWGSESLRS